MQVVLNKQEFEELYQSIAECYQGNICLAWQAARELHRKAVAHLVADSTTTDWQSAMLAYLLCELYACCGDDCEAAWLKLLARQLYGSCQNKKKNAPNLESGA